MTEYNTEKNTVDILFTQLLQAINNDIRTKIAQTLIIEENFTKQKACKKVGIDPRSYSRLVKMYGKEGDES